MAVLISNNSGDLDRMDMDDEGYNEFEDFHLSIQSSSTLHYLHDKYTEGSGAKRRTTVEQGKYDDQMNGSTPWEELAVDCPPPPPLSVLSWDRLQIPIPFRFHKDHVRIAKVPSIHGVTTNFALDSMDKSKLCVDMAWNVGDNPPPNSKFVYISSQQFIENALHLISGRSSIVFCLKEGQLVKNPSILVYGISPSTLENFSQPLLQLGNIVKQLGRIGEDQCQFIGGVEKCQQYNDSGWKWTIVEAAFIKFTENYLKVFQTILMLKFANIKSFTQLLSFVRPFRHQLEVLYKIWFECKSPHDSSVFLSHLNYLLLTECSPYSSALIRNVFLSCAAAYLRYVSDWMFRGQLPPRSEFHITNTRDQPYRDRRFWSKQFVHANVVPAFLTESWKLVFETGKVVSFLKQIQKERVFPSACLIICDQEMQVVPITSFEDLENLYSKWNCIVQQFQETRAYLTSEITASIKNVFPVSQSDFDQNEIIKNSEEFAKQCYSSRSISYERKRQKQLEIREYLNKQVEEAKERRRMEAVVSESETKRDREYLVMKEKRDQDEEKRFRSKHFGDDSPEILNQNFFQRLHGAQSKYSLKTVSSDLDTSLPVTLNSNNNGYGDCKDGVGVTKHKMMNEHVPFVHTSKQNEKGDGPNIIVSNVADDTVSLDKNNCSELVNEEKLDPSRLITTDPPAYDISHINSSALSTKTRFICTDVCSTLNTMNEELSVYPQNLSPVRKQQDVHSLNLFLSQAVTVPANIQCEMANVTLLNFFICEKRLFHHICGLNNFLCLQNGLFGHTITALLIEEVNRQHMKSEEDILARICRLNLILSEAISVSVESEDDKETSTNLALSLSESSLNQGTKGTGNLGSSIYESLNSIKLCYNVIWPLNVILTEDVLHYFERVFLFQMRLYRVELLLQSVFLQLKPTNFQKSQQLFTLHTYRSRLLHFVRTTRNYVNVTVIQSAWTELCSSFEKMNSLDKIYDSLVRHIKTIHTNCLLGTKAEGVMKLLVNQLIIIETFCSQLLQLQSTLSKSCRGNNRDQADYPEISQQEFKKLSQKFKAIEEIGKVFVEVAYKLVNRGYYPKVAYFLELYNFNGFFTKTDDAPPKDTLAVTFK